MRQYQFKCINKVQVWKWYICFERISLKIKKKKTREKKMILIIMNDDDDDYYVD